jgi:hypothetical protein
MGTMTPMGNGAPTPTTAAMPAMGAPAPAAAAAAAAAKTAAKHHHHKAAAATPTAM